MKSNFSTSFKPSFVNNGLQIPTTVTAQSGLKNADMVSAFGTKNTLLLLDEVMTPWQMVEAIKLLHDVSRTLIGRLSEKAKDYQRECVPIYVPKDMLEFAGIPEGAPLDVQVDFGELYITEAEVECEEDEPLYGVPAFLQEMLLDRGLDIGALCFFLGCEDEEDEE